MIGALPFSMRSDLDIVSVSKYVYSHCKGDMSHFQKSLQTEQFKQITDLIDKDEQPLDILENTGLAKFLIKSPKFTKLLCLATFSEEMPDIQAASFLGKSLVKVLESNEIGVCNAKALE